MYIHTYTTLRGLEIYHICTPSSVSYVIMPILILNHTWCYFVTDINTVCIAVCSNESPTCIPKWVCTVWFFMFLNLCNKKVGKDEWRYCILRFKSYYFRVVLDINGRALWWLWYTLKYTLSYLISEWNAALADAEICRDVDTSLRLRNEHKSQTVIWDSRFGTREQSLF